LNWGSKGTSSSIPHEQALQTYQGPTAYLGGDSGIIDGSAEVLVTTVTGPISQTGQSPITYEYDVESQQIRKETDVSWSEDKR
jgi:hypothetical protein